MNGHDRLLAAFLAGDLRRAAARKWDEHLLECEACWRAVREDRAGHQAARLLRQPAPGGLADRVVFAVELAAAGADTPRPRGRVRLRRSWLAAAGTLALGLGVTLVMLLVAGGRASMPAPVAVVARYAETMPPPAHRAGLGTGRQAAPVAVGHPVTMTAGGHHIVVRTWRLGGTEVVAATSGQPFPMPPGGHGVSGGGMAWVAQAGILSLYCLNGQTSELVAAPVPAAELAALAARLPLA